MTRVSTVTIAALAFWNSVGFAANSNPLPGVNTEVLSPEFITHIEQLSYQPLSDSQSKDTLIANNPRFAMQARFDSKGVTLSPLPHSDIQGWWWQLSLNDAKKVSPIWTDERVEYRRGNMVEWYVNNADGIEQGFTFASKETGSNTLRVTLTTQGSLVPSVKDNRLQLATANGSTILQYDKLHAFDSTNRTLPATMVLKNNLLVLSVDAKDAVFPVTIDPITTSTQLVLGGPASLSQFGYSALGNIDVNGDGNTDLIVGAPTFINPPKSNPSRCQSESDNSVIGAGAIFVFLGTSTGFNKTPSWCFASDQENASFGASLENVGDTNQDGIADIAVGATHYGEPLNGKVPTYNERGGAVFIFRGHRQLSTTEFAGMEIPADDSQRVVYHRVPAGDSSYAGIGNARFGFQLKAIPDPNDNTKKALLVSAPYQSYRDPHPEDATSEGLEYGLVVMYQLSEGRFAPLSSFTPQFSEISTDVAFADSSPTVRKYPVYIRAHFGASISNAVDLTGDGINDIAIGMPGMSLAITDNNELKSTIVFCGAIRLFVGISGSFKSAGYTVIGNRPGMELGYALATSTQQLNLKTNVLIAGAPSDTVSPDFPGSGSIHLFSFDNNGKKASQSTQYVSSSGARLGGSLLTIRGQRNFVLASAIGFSIESKTVGAVFGFNFNSNILERISWWTSGKQPSLPDGSGGFGKFMSEVRVSVSDTGDIRTNEILIAGTFDSNQQELAGSLFSFPVINGELSTPVDWSYASNSPISYVANSYATGNFDGDTNTDLVLVKNDGGNSQLLVFAGTSEGSFETSPKWILNASQVNRSFGKALAVKDINNDTVDDILVSDPLYRNASGNNQIVGAVYIFLSKVNNGQVTWKVEFQKYVSDQILTGTQAEAMFGSSIAIGNFDDDTEYEIAVGAIGYDNILSPSNTTYIDSGSVSVFDVVKSADTPPLYSINATTDTKFTTSQSEASFGYSVAFIPKGNDTNKDSLYVGAPYYDTTQGSTLVDSGAVFVFDHGLDTPRQLLTGVSFSPYLGVYGRFGTAITATGDSYGGDAIVDFAVSAPGQGHVLLFSQRNLSFPVSRYSTTQLDSGFGESLFASSDLDRDGQNDLVIGAPYYHPFDSEPLNPNNNQYGAVFVYPGIEKQGFSSIFNAVFFPDESGSNFGAQVGVLGAQHADTSPTLPALLVNAPRYHYQIQPGALIIKRMLSSDFIVPKNNINHRPIAVLENKERRIVKEDNFLALPNVVGNDIDDDGDIVQFVDYITNNGKTDHGSISESSGIYKYIPNQDYFGSDSLSYLATDGKGGYTVGKFEIEVTPVPDKPTVQSYSVKVARDVVTKGPLHAINPDGDNLTFKLVKHASHGTATIINKGDGTAEFIYYSDGDLNAIGDEFTYTASNTTETSEEGTVFLTYSANISKPTKPKLTWPPVGYILPKLDNDLTVYKINLQWAPSTDLDGGIIQYRVVYCDNVDFNCGTNAQSPTVTAPSGKTNDLYIAGAVSSSVLFAGLVMQRRILSRRRKFLHILMLLGVVLLTHACGGGSNAGDANDNGDNSAVFSMPIYGLVPGNTYYWKVVASDGDHQVDSDVWQFVVPPKSLQKR